MDSLRNILAIAILLTAGELRPQTLLSIGSQTAYPGASVNVPVTFTRATNVVAAQFDVTFDPDRVASGPAVADQVGRHVVLSREIAPGVRRVLMFSRQNSVVTNRNPVQLPFAVAPTEYQGSGPLAPANAILARANATPVAPLALGDGAIFVRQVNMLPDGRVQFFLPSTPHQ